MTRVIVLGLDGGTWDLIKPWADEGILPTFKRLMENGAWGTLESTLPPSTVPAWPSMLTGKKPERLGIYYFTRRSSESYEPTLHRSMFDGAIWDILGSQGRQSYVINVPGTEPLGEDRTTGVFIAGPIIAMGDLTGDPRIMSLIEKTGYRRGVPQRPTDADQEEPRLTEVISRSKNQFALVTELLHESWDLLFYVNFLTDWVSHFYWKYLDEASPEYKENERIKSLVKDFYVEIDRFLDLLTSNASHLFVVSDHGFGPLYCEINLNGWLVQEELQVRRATSRSTGSKVERTPPRWLPFLQRIGRFPAIRPVARRIAPLVIPKKAKPLRRRSIFEDAPVMDAIDWSRSKAYSIYYMGVNVNLRGREPLGCVESSEYEQVRDDIISRALRIRDNEGRRVIEAAYRVEDIYDNPPHMSFPDIVLVPKDGKYRNRVNVNLGLSREVFTKFDDSGGHRKEGILLAYGSGVKKGYKVDSARIHDVTPTILHVLGVPIPPDVDGRVLKEVFEEGSELARRETVCQDVKAVDPREQLRRKARVLRDRGRL